MPNGRAHTETASLESGVEVLRSLVEVYEEDAEGTLKETYRDIKETLRVPFVNALFRVLAAGPPFLVPAWCDAHPIVSTLAFEERADRLRRYVAERIKDAPEGLVSGLPESEEVPMRAYLDSVHYVLPKLALVGELFDRIVAGETGGSVDLPDEPIPKGIAKDTGDAPLKTADQAGPAVANTFKDIQRRHDHPIVASFYRGLANWPLFLQSAWGTVAVTVGTDDYLDLRADIQHKARELVAELRLDEAAVEEAGLRESDRQELRDLLAVFRHRLIPDLLQDVTRIKAALDGVELAADSRFSVTRTDLHQPSHSKKRESTT